MPYQNHIIFEFLAKKLFLETITNSLLCTENDYAALFALCLLYALANNQVIVTNSGRNLILLFSNILCNNKSTLYLSGYKS